MPEGDVGLRQLEYAHDRRVLRGVSAGTRPRACSPPAILPHAEAGSWLNIAENELSSLTRQCVAGRRFGTLAKLQTEIAAWSNDVNNTQRGVDWQMKVSDARCKLKSLYPNIRV